MQGTRFRHFQVEQLLGRGGMGEVYLATDTTLERQVALKFLPRDLMGDPTAQKRLLDEARSCCRVQHPNIATVFSIEEDGGVYAMVMEYVEGRTLREVIARQQLSLARVVRIGRAIAAGMAAAHEQGVIHRDLKPANVMLTQRGEVKIMDFGLAFRPERLVNTAQNKAFGTVNYMSPEQARGKPPTASSDIFSYGVLLYEILTGSCPFQGENDLAVLHSIVDDEPPALREIRRDTPPALEAIIRRCMRKQISERFSSMAELAGELHFVEPVIENGPKDLISELAIGLHDPTSQATTASSPSTPRRRSGDPLAENRFNDGLPEMAPALNVPISDILSALDETTSSGAGDNGSSMDGFILTGVPTGPARTPQPSKDLIIQSAHADYAPPAADKPRVGTPRAGVQAKPTQARSARSSKGAFLSPEGGNSTRFTGSSALPPRITAPPRQSPLRNLLGLLIGLILAALGFLGLLRAAGVESVPGSELIDRIPEALSRSSAPTGELGVLERLIPSEEGDAEDVTPEPPEASQPEIKPLPAETSRATADSLDQI